MAVKFKFSKPSTPSAPEVSKESKSELAGLLGKVKTAEPAKEKVKPSVKVDASVDMELLNAAAATVTTPAKTTSSGEADRPELHAMRERFASVELPDGCTQEEVDELMEGINVLYESFDQPELVSQAIPMVMAKLQEQPEFAHMLRPCDFGIMVRALRESYGVQVTKKAARKTSRSAKKEIEQEVAKDLVDIDLGDLGL